MSAGIWLYNRDADGTVTSVSIVVRPCANDPDPDARDERGIHVWAHGLAEVIADKGATLLCWPCARERCAEQARQARLKRLPSMHRDWLEARGVTDWNPKGA